MRQQEGMINLKQIGLHPIEMIGSGSDGIVVKAVNPITEKHYAVKIVSLSGQHKVRFDNEASNILHIGQHSNIIATKAYHKLSNCGLIVMELLEGDLMHYFVSNGKMTEKKIKNIFLKMCKAVEHCHRNNIAHLDIKPDNFLISHNAEEVKLCDFTRSLHYNNEDEKFHLFSQQLTSAKYRPPELRIPNTRVDVEKVDVWSLGVCLFGLLFGVFPFLVNNNGEVDYNNLIIIQHLRGDLAEEKIADSTKDLIMKLLTFDPVARPNISSVLSHPYFK